MDWQPIETARRLAGQRILAADETGEVLIVFWDAEAEAFLDETLDLPEYRLMHWAPLPKPPGAQ